MCEVPRGREGHECLRVRFVRAKTPEGSEVAWHDVREYFKSDDGSWRPTKKGISIKSRELGAVAVAFLRAVASSIPHELHPSAKALVEALEAKAKPEAKRELLPHEEYARRRGQVPR